MTLPKVSANTSRQFSPPWLSSSAKKKSQESIQGDFHALWPFTLFEDWDWKADQHNATHKHIHWRKKKKTDIKKPFYPHAPLALNRRTMQVLSAQSSVTWPDFTWLMHTIRCQHATHTLVTWFIPSGGCGFQCFQWWIESGHPLSTYAPLLSTSRVCYQNILQGIWEVRR